MNLEQLVERNLKIDARQNPGLRDGKPVNYGTASPFPSDFKTKN
jgi:hypothetical protein